MNNGINNIDLNCNNFKVKIFINNSLLKQLTHLLNRISFILYSLLLIFPSSTLFADDLFFSPDNLTQVNAQKYLMKSKKHTDGTFIDKDKKGAFLDKKQNNSDTVKREDKIISITEVNEQFVVKIELINYDQEVSLIVYNMLGKQVLEIFRGFAHQDPDYPYSFNASILPNGIYFCVLQGRNFRKARKFIVAR